MSDLHRVTLSGDYDHHPAHGDERVFRAGVHAMSTDVLKAARAAGKVEKSELILAGKAAEPARVRKAPAKAKAPQKPAAAAKPFPAKVPAKKPAAKKAKA